MSDTSALTAIQQSVLDFIRGRLAAGRSAPTLREVAAEFGWSSKRAAACHIEALVRKGCLKTDPGKARSLRLVSAQAFTAEPVFSIPMLGSIPAGFSREREPVSASGSGSESDECVPVTVESIGFTPTRNTFALRVTGDSMIEAHICDGDIAVFEHGPEPRSGQIVAALIDGKNTLKTFVIKRGRTFLKAENAKYPALIPSEELVIQGVFRALIRKIKD